jgi:hypothetical protein
MDLSIQEQEVINALRRLAGYERIEIMKDDKGYLGIEYVVFRASKIKILATGKIIPQQQRSKAIYSD